MDYSNHRKPLWLKKKLPSSPCFGETKYFLETRKLNTVCEEARCPNRWECFSKKSATFLIMGPYCTRNCSFCSVEHRRPNPLRDEEIDGISEFIDKMELKYVVITSVTRDDLEDGGASFFARLVRRLKKTHPDLRIELLVPDFMGSISSLNTVISCRPDVVNHNIETVSRLYKKIRPGADYTRSLELLKKTKELAENLLVKSGIMVGLGETEDELISTISDIRNTGCDILTIGQYLQPTRQQVKVAKYYTPDEFLELHEIAKNMGFKEVVSGPFVRSSYRAFDVFNNIKNKKELV